MTDTKVSAIPVITTGLQLNDAFRIHRAPTMKKFLQALSVNAGGTISRGTKEDRRRRQCLANRQEYVPANFVRREAAKILAAGIVEAKPPRKVREPLEEAPEKLAA